MDVHLCLFSGKEVKPVWTFPKDGGTHWEMLHGGPYGALLCVHSTGGSGLVDRHKTLLIANTRGVVRMLAEWRNALKAKRLVQRHRRQLAVAGFDPQGSVVKGQGGSL